MHAGNARKENVSPPTFTSSSFPVGQMEDRTKHQEIAFTAYSHNQEISKAKLKLTQNTIINDDATQPKPKLKRLGISRATRTIKEVAHESGIGKVGSLLQARVDYDKSTVYTGSDVAGCEAMDSSVFATSKDDQPVSNGRIATGKKEILNSAVFKGKKSEESYVVLASKSDKVDHMDNMIVVKSDMGNSDCKQGMSSPRPGKRKSMSELRVDAFQRKRRHRGAIAVNSGKKRDPKTSTPNENNVDANAVNGNKSVDVQMLIKPEGPMRDYLRSAAKGKKTPTLVKEVHKENIDQSKVNDAESHDGMGVLKSGKALVNAERVNVEEGASANTRKSMADIVAEIRLVEKSHVSKHVNRKITRPGDESEENAKITDCEMNGSRISDRPDDYIRQPSSFTHANVQIAEQNKQSMLHKLKSTREKKNKKSKQKSSNSNSNVKRKTFAAFKSVAPDSQRALRDSRNRLLDMEEYHDLDEKYEQNLAIYNPDDYVDELFLRNDIELPSLNDEQNEAVSHAFTKSTLILAGAGTGKTRTLIARIIAMVKSVVMPNHILAISFTNKAVKEMKERLLQSLPKHMAMAVTVSTFHGMCFRILSRNYERLGFRRHPRILTPANQKSLLKEIHIRIQDRQLRINLIKLLLSKYKLPTLKISSRWKEVIEFVTQATGKEKGQLLTEFCIAENIQESIINEEEDPAYHHHVSEVMLRAIVPKHISKPFEQPKIKDIKGTLDLINYAKQHQHKPNDYTGTTAEYFQNYIDLCLKKCLVDFNDMLVLVKKLFVENKGIREAFKRRYQYLLVDEFQDLNQLQYEVMSLMTSNVTAVGDDDQSIYAFRGAMADKIFKNFQENSTTVTLRNNYRCTGNILRVARECLAGIEKRIDKKLRTTKADGDVVHRVTTHSDLSQAEFVAKEINKIMNEHRDLTFDDFAILTRAMKMNSSNTSTKIESAMRYAGIPLRIIGGSSILDSKDVLCLSSYLHLVLDCNDDFACLTSLGRVRSVGVKTVNTIKRIQKTLNGASLFDTLNHVVHNRQDLGGVVINAISGFLEEYIDWCTKSIYMDIIALLKYVYRNSDLMKDRERDYKMNEQKNKDTEYSNMGNATRRRSVQGNPEGNISCSSEHDDDEYDAVRSPYFLKVLIDEAYSFLKKRRSVFEQGETITSQYTSTKSLTNSLYDRCRAAIVQQIDANPEIASECLQHLQRDVISEMYEPFHRGPAVLSEFLNTVALNNNVENAENKDTEVASKPKVTLSTIHRSKGLEWKVVFVLFWNEGILPAQYRPGEHNKFKPDNQGKKNKSDTYRDSKLVEDESCQHFEEEQRCAHVAITRAQEQLYVISVNLLRNTQGKFESCESSKIVDFDVLPPESYDLEWYKSADDEACEQDQSYALKPCIQMNEYPSDSVYDLTNHGFMNYIADQGSSRDGRRADVATAMPVFTTAGRLYAEKTTASVVCMQRRPANSRRNTSSK
eukprot:CFRG6321T1